MKYPKITKLTEKQTAMLAVYRDEWIANALKACPTTDDDRERIIRAVHGLYEAAGLKAPKQVYVVASPYALAMEGGAMEYWCKEYHDVPPDADKLACFVSVRQKEVNDARRNSLQSWQGGYEWSGWCSMLAFWRDEMELGKRPELAETYASYAHWETLARLSGWRLLTEDFAMVSERPLVLKTYVNSQGVHVPHCEDGPTHAWRDGMEIYHIDGVRVPKKVVMEPDKLILDEIRNEKNAEVRRIMRNRYGEGRYLQETGAKLLDADFEGVPLGAAPRALLRDEDGVVLVGTDGSTSRTYYMPIPDTIDVKTCREAHEALCGFSEERIISKS